MSDFWTALAEITTIPARLDRIEDQLNRIVSMLLTDAKREKAMARKLHDISQELDDLEAAARENADAGDALIAEFKKLADLMEASAGHEDRILALAQGTRERARRMVEAAAEGTDFNPSGN